MQLRSRLKFLTVMSVPELKPILRILCWLIVYQPSFLVVSPTYYSTVEAAAMSLAVYELNPLHKNKEGCDLEQIQVNRRCGVLVLTVQPLYSMTDLER